MTTTSQTVPAGSKALDARLAKIEQTTDKEWLLETLATSLAAGLEHLIAAAAAVKRLETLGHDLSDLRITILPDLRKIAYGHMLPTLYWHLGGNRRLLRYAEKLPAPDQATIADNRPLRVVEPDGDHRQVPAWNLSPAEMRQVFASDHIRNDDEQLAFIRDEARRQTKPTPDDLPIAVDLKRNGLQVGARFIPAHDLAVYLTQLTGIRKAAR